MEGSSTRVADCLDRRDRSRLGPASVALVLCRQQGRRGRGGADDRTRASHRRRDARRTHGGRERKRP